jgi:hypothetical protein
LEDVCGALWVKIIFYSKNKSVSKIKEKWCVVNVFHILVNVTFKVGLAPTNHS